MDELFAAPGAAWTPVSPSLTTVARISSGLVGLAGLVLAVGSWVLFGPWVGVPVTLVVVVGSAVDVALAPRRTRAWGYAERGDDLYVRHGLMVRRLTVVPYGRMQFVDVAAGPLMRRYRISTVRMHTASPDSDVVIQGVPTPDAVALRDRLTERGEAQAAGL